jgi:hypothetical protein
MLFFKLGLEDSDPKAHSENATKSSRLASLLKGLEKRCEEADDDTQIVELVETLHREHPQAWPEDRIALAAALTLDGFDFVDDKLVATTPAPIALAPQISALELEMERRGLQVAIGHYKQAVDNFTRGNWEAANSQVRSFLESLFITLCKTLCGKGLADVNGALQHLRGTGKLDLGEWNNFRYFWNDIQDNGPHQGLSVEHEALYRLHVATATARYLLEKFQ